MKQIQIGSLEKIKQPALIAFSESQSWCFEHDTVSFENAACVVEYITLQLLSKCDLGCAKLVLFESKPSPQFAAIKRLLAASTGQYGEQHFKLETFKKNITRLEELTHQRFALLAQKDATTIEQYNQQTGAQEATIYVLINGLSEALTQADVLTQLVSLSKEGPKIGVVPIFIYDKNEDVSHSAIDAQRQIRMKQFWQTIQQHAIGLRWEAETQVSSLNIDKVLWNLFNKFDLNVFDVSEVKPLIKHQTDILLKILKTSVETSTRKDFLHLAIGMNGGNIVHIDMGDYSNVFHAMIGGTTGVGKTSLLNTIILGICENYTPDEIQVSLIDHKEKGISFYAYEGIEQVTDLYAPLEHDFPAALKIIENFSNQRSSRNQLFREAGVKDIAGFNALPNHVMPRKVLIIDECQKLFESLDYKFRDEVALHLGRIAREGRSSGLHIILCTQDYENVKLGKDAFRQFNLRIGLRLADMGACINLMGIGRSNYEQLMTLPYYSAVYNPNQGEEVDNLIVRLEDSNAFFQSRLADIKSKYAKPNDQPAA
jgi:FtsK/SpoIIIE family